MTKVSSPLTRSRLIRRVGFFGYISAIGVISNLLAPMPFDTMPFLLGNTALVILAQRLGLRWALAAMVPVLWPVPTLALQLLSVLHVLLVAGLAWRWQWSLRKALLMRSLLLLPLMILIAEPSQADLRLWSLNVAILWLALMTQEIATSLVLRVIEASRGQAQPLSRLLANWLTVGTAAPLAMAALLVLDIYIDDHLEHEEQALQLNAATLASQIGAALEQHQQALVASATLLQASDISLQQRALAALKAHYPGFSSLQISDANGRITSSLPGAAEGATDIAGLAIFQQPETTHNTYASGVIGSNASDRNMHIAISTPQFDHDARFAGVLAGTIDVMALVPLQQLGSENNDLPFVLQDQHDQIILSNLRSSGRSAALDGHDPRLRQFDRREVKSDEYVQSLNATGSDLVHEQRVLPFQWRLLMLRSYQPLAEHYAGLTVLTILLCLAIMLVSQIFAMVFSRLFAAPLDQLLRRVRELDLDAPDTLHPVTVTTPVAEIQEFAASFSQLVARQTVTYAELRASLALLDSANQQLEHRVNERTMELANARDHAERLASVKAEFLANMSHELRTPLTAIIGFTEQVLRLPLDGTAHSMMQTIHRNALFLLKLVNDILDASKLEFDKIELETITLSPLQLVSELVRGMEPKAQQQQLQLEFVPEFPLPEQVQGDPTRIRQVLYNLLGNALKFTEHGGVTVRLSAEPTGQEWYLSIRDTGIGMTTEQQQRLFQPFAQADASTTRRFGGSGLGLYISRQLILRMGGTFLLESKVGAGCHFQIALPTNMAAVEWLDAANALPAELATPALATTLPRLHGRVLVAEDVDDLQQLLQLMIGNTGATVTVVGNGELACAAALAAPFDLVLMDMHMPVLDGEAATQRLRSRGYNGAIVALTADVMASDVERFRAAGCDQVLSKPVREAALMAVLSQYLSPANVPPAAAPVVPENIQALLATLGQQFRQRLQSDAEHLRDELQQQNWLALQARLHKLKGAAGTFGFPGLSQQAESCYRLLQQQQYAEAIIALEQLQQSLQQEVAP